MKNSKKDNLKEQNNNGKDKLTDEERLFVNNIKTFLSESAKQEAPILEAIKNIKIKTLIDPKYIKNVKKYSNKELELIIEKALSLLKDGADRSEFFYGLEYLQEEFKNYEKYKKFYYEVLDEVFCYYTELFSNLMFSLFPEDEKFGFIQRTIYEKFQKFSDNFFLLVKYGYTSYYGTDYSYELLINSICKKIRVLNKDEEKFIKHFNEGIRLFNQYLYKDKINVIKVANYIFEADEKRLKLEGDKLKVDFLEWEYDYKVPVLD